jgi:hypothetical protein
VIITQLPPWAVAAELRAALAAVLDQEREQVADRHEIDRIEDAPLVAPRNEEARALELREVRRHGRSGDAQAVRDLAGGQPARSLPHEQPEHPQPMLLGEPRQPLDRRPLIHIS